MQEAVSAILVGRSREVDGLSRMVDRVARRRTACCSRADLCCRATGCERGRAERETPMIISLGGVHGPDTGGMTSIAARAVQAERRRSQAPSTPRRPKTPEMVDARRRTPKPKPVAEARRRSRSTSRRRRSRSTGAEVKTGPRGSRPARGAGAVRRAGVRSAAGPAACASTANFCCPEYIETMTAAIRTNWNRRSGRDRQGRSQVHDPARRHAGRTSTSSKTSGNPLLDLESRRAVLHDPAAAAAAGSVHAANADGLPYFRVQALMTSHDILSLPCWRRRRAAR